AIGLELFDAAISVERARSTARDRGVGVVLLGHELGIEQLLHVLVELATLLAGLLDEPVEIHGIDVPRDPALGVGGAGVTVGGDDGVSLHTVRVPATWSPRQAPTDANGP